MTGCAKLFAIGFATMLLLAGCQTAPAPDPALTTPATPASAPAPDPAPATPASAPVKVWLMGLQIHNKDSKLVARVPGDYETLKGYGRAIEDRLFSSLGGLPSERFNGILVTVGVKPGGARRVWCEGVGDELPDDLRVRLQQELAEVAAPEVKGGPIAFNALFAIKGRPKPNFPQFPREWIERINLAGQGVMMPDGLFELIWPDPPAAQGAPASPEGPSPQAITEADPRPQLYMPISKASQRLVGDPKGLIDYSLALQRRFLAELPVAPNGEIKGVQVSVGFKPGGERRVWCEGVGADLPPDVAERLQAALSEEQPPPLREGPLAFGFRFVFRGRPTPEFPWAPRAWLHAMEVGGPNLDMPDGLFRLIWPSPITPVPAPAPTDPAPPPPR